MKKNIALTLTRMFLMTGLALLSLSAVAQDYIDEDFLATLETNARPLMDEQAPAFKENSTPSKWNNESAVVIGYARSILFDRKSRGGFLSRKETSLWFIEKDHFKIRVNDNNSVQAFSELYFRYGSKEDGFSARIVKSDGSIRTLDLKTAVAVERKDDVPEYFQSFFDKVANSEYQYYKTPIADLEPGDILEYVATTKSKLNVTSSGYIEFAPVYEVCSKKYPIMHNEIDIETDDKSFFKYLSVNGAPEFHKENTTESGFYRYVFVDKNRETEKDVNFVSPLLKYPLVKFQVIYSNNDQAKGALIGEKGELKNEFSREELARKAWEDYEMIGDAYYSQGQRVSAFVSTCWSELQKLGAKNWPEQQFIDRAYYLVRDKVVFRDTYMSDKLFAYIFGSLLYQRDIKSDLIITISNNIGKLKQVLFDDEIRYAIRVNNKLYFNATDFSNPGDLDENLLDNEAYIIYAPAKKGGQQEIKPYVFPGTTAADNMNETSIKSQLSTDMKSLLVIRTTTLGGIQKAKSIGKALSYTPYMLDDYKNYGGNPPSANLKARELENYNSSVQAMQEEFARQKTESVKESLESEFEQRVRDIHYSLVNDGRNQDKPLLIVKEGFELQDFVRKAGKKFMINLPGLIGSQLQIKKEERDRKYDIDVRYPKTFAWNIEFKIPDGYAAEGLAEINRSVDNETGSFVLSAKEENGSVLLKVVKVYKQKLIAREKWTDMLSFLDAAYNSSFKYILLVPKK
jgi:hypothetical protein